MSLSDQQRYRAPSAGRSPSLPPTHVPALLSPIGSRARLPPLDIPELSGTPTPDRHNSSNNNNNNNNTLPQTLAGSPPLLPPATIAGGSGGQAQVGVSPPQRRRISSDAPSRILLTSMLESNHSSSTIPGYLSPSVASFPFAPPVAYTDLAGPILRKYQVPCSDSLLRSPLASPMNDSNVALTVDCNESGCVADTEDNNGSHPRERKSMTREDTTATMSTISVTSSNLNERVNAAQAVSDEAEEILREGVAAAFSQCTLSPKQSQELAEDLTVALLILQRRFQHYQAQTQLSLASHSVAQIQRRSVGSRNNGQLFDSFAATDEQSLTASGFFSTTEGLPPQASGSSRVASELGALRSPQSRRTEARLSNSHRSSTGEVLVPRRPPSVTALLRAGSADHSASFVPSSDDPATSLNGSFFRRGEATLSGGGRGSQLGDEEDEDEDGDTKNELPCAGGEGDGANPLEFADGSGTNSANRNSSISTMDSFSGPTGRSHRVDEQVAASRLEMASGEAKEAIACAKPTERDAHMLRFHPIRTPKEASLGGGGTRSATVTAPPSLADSECVCPPQHPQVQRPHESISLETVVPALDSATSTGSPQDAFVQTIGPEQEVLPLARALSSGSKAEAEAMLDREGEEGGDVTTWHQGPAVGESLHEPPISLELAVVSGQSSATRGDGHSPNNSSSVIATANESTRHYDASPMSYMELEPPGLKSHSPSFRKEGSQGTGGVQQHSVVTFNNSVSTLGSLRLQGGGNGQHDASDPFTEFVQNPFHAVPSFGTGVISVAPSRAAGHYRPSRDFGCPPAIPTAHPVTEDLVLDPMSSKALSFVTIYNTNVDAVVPPAPHRLFGPDRRFSIKNTQSIADLRAAIRGGALPNAQDESHGIVLAVPHREQQRSGDCDEESPPCDPLHLLMEGSQTSCGSLSTQRRTVLTKSANVHSDEFGVTTVNDYIIEDTLGAGAYGVVYLGTRLSDNEKVAIKCIKRETFGFRRAPSMAPPAGTKNQSLQHHPSKATHLMDPASPVSPGKSFNRLTSHLHGGDSHSTSFAHNPMAAYVQSLHSNNNNESCSPPSNSSAAAAAQEDYLYLDYSILKEVAIMKLVNNKHIIRLHEAILDPAQKMVYLIMQFVGGGCILEKSYSAAAASLHNSNAKGTSLTSTPLRPVCHRDESQGNNSSASPSSFHQAQCLPHVSSEYLFDSNSSSMASGTTSHLANQPAQSHNQRQRNALWAAMAAAGEVVYKMLPKATIISYTRQIVSGLFYLHQKGILHRDIKPDNLLLDVSKKNVYLADFGVSEICKDDMKGDVGRVLIGTPFYMAPELFDASNNKLTGAIDIWALGVTIYAMATGRLPFVGRSESEVRRAVLETEPNYPSDLDEGLAALIKEMLRKDPDERISIQVLVKGTKQMTPATNRNFKKHLEIVDEMALTGSFAAPPPFIVDENNTLGTAAPPEFVQVVPNPRGRGPQATGPTFSPSEFDAEAALQEPNVVTVQGPNDSPVGNKGNVRSGSGEFTISEEQMQAAFRILLPASAPAMVSLPSSRVASGRASPL